MFFHKECEMSIKHWPEMERPREKLLYQGAASLTDAELLAIFLRTGTAGKSAVELARELIIEFGGLRQLMTAERSAFCNARGLGNAKFAQLQAVLEMGKRHHQQPLSRGEKLVSPADTCEFLRRRLRDYHYEVFACLYLDNRHRVISFRELFRGTIDCSSVYPREVVQQALAEQAAAVIFSHNHPSGEASPSESDLQITRKLKAALNLVDIRVLDHIIVADTDTVSLADLGLI
jgi:DNA repair protein RadC